MDVLHALILAATIYLALGIVPATRLIDPQGRPSLMEDGEPVRELFA
jgi:hypothetical protein